MLLRNTKKLIILSVFLALFPSIIYGQNIGDFRSKVAGNWNAPASWERCVTGGTWVGATSLICPPVGGAGAAVNITIIHTISVNVAVSNNSNLVINAGGILQTLAGFALTNAATGVITNNGLITNSTTLTTGTIINNGSINNNLTINSNGVFTNNLTINNAAGATITQIGTGAFSNTAAGTITNLGTITVNTGRTITSNGTIYNSSVINSGGGFGTLTFPAATSYYKHDFSSSAAATGTIPLATWGIGSTCEVIACGNSGSAPVNLGQAFRHFIWNNTTQPVDVNANGTLINIQNNFSLISTSSFRLVLKTTSGANTTVGGNLTVSGGNIVVENNASSFAGVNNLSVGGNLVVSGGSLSLTTSTGSAVGTNGSGNLLVTGTTTISGGTLNIASGAWAGASGGIGTMTATGDITLSGGTINLCSSGGAGSAPHGNGTINLTGSFIMTSGTLDLSSSSTTGGGGLGEFNIGGNFTHSGGTVSKTGINSGTIKMIGAGAVTIESIGFNAPNVIAFEILQNGGAGCSIALGDLFVLNTGTTLTINDDPSFATDLTVNGTLTANTNTWTCDPASSTVFSGTGVFINNSTGAIAANSLSTTLSFSAASIFRVNGDGGEVATATWNALSNVEITGLVAATTVGNGGQSFGKINWNSPGQTSSADFGATGFGVQTDYTFTSTGTGIARFPDVDFTIGTAVALTNRLILSGTSTLQVSNAPLLFATGNRTITINGHVTVAAGAFMKVGSPNTGGGSSVTDRTKDITLVVKRNLIFAAATLVSFDHRSFAGFGDDSYRLLFTLNGAAAQTLTIPVSALNMVTTSGDGVVNSGLDDEFTNTNAYSINISGASTIVTQGASLKSHEFTIGAGASLITSGAGLNFNLIDYSLLNAAGAADNPSTVVNGTINFFGALGTSNLSDASGTGTFTLSSTGTLITKHTQGITSTGSGLTGSVQVSGVRTYNSGADYTYNSALAQVTGNGLPGTLVSTCNLTIAHTGAIATLGVTLTQSTSTAGALTLTSGRLITTSTNLMTIAAGGTSSGGAGTAFVDGPIKKIGNTAFIFPTGDVYLSPANTAKWARIAISAPSTVSDAFTAEYDKLNDPCNTNQAVSNTNGSGIDHVSYKEYWNLTRDVGSSVPVVTLYWENGSVSTSAGSAIASTASTDLHVAEFYSGQWNTLGQGAISGVPAGPGTISNSSAASFTTTVAMPFTFGAPNTINPLPVELLSFSGFATDEGNQISWSTASETNCDYFDLERSSDGNYFEKIATLSGQGTSTALVHYDHLDATPVSGRNYYRLNQFDFDGNHNLSSIVTIDGSLIDESPVQVYPNPANDLINIITSEYISSVTIYNMLGELVFSTTSKASRVQFDPVSKGIYLMKAVSENGKEYFTRVVKN